MKTIEIFKTMSGAISNIGSFIVGYNQHKITAEEAIGRIEQILFSLTKELEGKNDNT